MISKFWTYSDAVIVDECSIAHSNRLTKTNRMVVNLSFYDHWMVRYLTKRQNRHFYIYETAPFDVLLNISPSNDHRRLYHSSFESSHQGESNGGKFILSQSPEGQIFDETSKIGIFYICKCRFLTFRQISGHPVIVKGQNYRHSIRLGETIRMSYRSFFCDHCMLRRIIRINPKSIRMELIRID